jgi:Uma2 family endonuclease
LREYALIDPDTRRVEVFRPGEDGHRKLFDMSASDTLSLASVSCEIALSAIFKGMGSDSP